MPNKIGTQVMLADSKVEKMNAFDSVQYDGLLDLNDGRV